MSEADSSTATHLPALSWRIPEGRSRVSLRFALVQIAFATVVVSLMVVFLSPAESQSGLITATIAMALLLAGFQTWRAFRDAQGPANVWLDARGLHWRDAEGHNQTLDRDLVRGFLIGHDEETRREVPSLTLLLSGDFVSQPVELHAPADEPTVRLWLREQWRIDETSQLPTESTISIALESGFDLHQQVWTLHGTSAALNQLADALADAARLPLPPVGARPHQIVLDFSGDPMGLAVSPHTWIDTHFFAASPEVLQGLSHDLRGRTTSPQDAFDIPLVTDTGHHWRLLVSVATASDTKSN